MGMHFGLVAVKGSISDFKSILPKLWPTFENTASAENFPNTKAVWAWMEEHEHFVSAAAWTKDNPGTKCAFLSQYGPWAIFMDPSYVMASDETALKLLSEQYGVALSFVVETAAGCANFWSYESGQLRRSIVNNGEEVETVGNALPEEEDLDSSDYYMEETEALIHAFGLPSIEDLPIPGATIAIALTDRTDYSELVSNSPNNAKSNRKKPWWKFW
jgi:hypothetical protein